MVVCASCLCVLCMCVMYPCCPVHCNYVLTLLFLPHPHEVRKVKKKKFKWAKENKKVETQKKTKKNRSWCVVVRGKISSRVFALPHITLTFFWLSHPSLSFVVSPFRKSHSMITFSETLTTSLPLRPGSLVLTNSPWSWRRTLTVSKGLVKRTAMEGARAETAKFSS